MIKAVKPLWKIEEAHGPVHPYGRYEGPFHLPPEVNCRAHDKTLESPESSALSGMTTA